MIRAAPLFALFALLALLVPTARADGETRHVSSEGSHYLLVRPAKEGGWAFELGIPASQEAGAVVLAAGTLPRRYDAVRVLDGEPGAVLFDEPARGADGDAVARLDQGGALRWRVSVKALFGGAPFPMDLGRLHWRRAAWVDEERGHVIVVARGALVRQVDLASGEAREAEAPIVLRGLALAAARSDAIEAVAELREALGADAVAPLASLIASGALNAAARRRAAEVLATLPREAVVDDVFKRMKNADAAATGALLDAAVATGAPDLMTQLRHREPELLKALDKRTGPLDWLADYFRTHPTSEAVRPLQAALAKNPRHPTLAPKLIGALKTCTGVDFGDNVDAWLRYRHPG